MNRGLVLIVDDERDLRTLVDFNLRQAGFTTAQATYGVNAVHANWNKQAAKSAKSYLDTQAFSRSGLISQLEYDGFTTAQATYGVHAVGL